MAFNPENNLIDVIKRIHWIRSYVKADIGHADIHGVTHLPSPNTQQFLSIDEINVKTLENWLNNLEDVSLIDQELLNEFDKKDHIKTKVIYLSDLIKPKEKIVPIKTTYIEYTIIGAGTNEILTGIAEIDTDTEYKIIIGAAGINHLVYSNHINFILGNDSSAFTLTSAGGAVNLSSGTVIIKYPDTYKTATKTAGNPIYTNENGNHVYTFKGCGSINW